jgi:hypothetical protein
MRRNASLLCAALAAVVASAGAVRGELITWSADWSRSPLSVAGDGNSGSVNLATPQPIRRTGSATVVAAILSASSSASASRPDVFDGEPYRVTLTLTDAATRAHGVVSFTGELFGTMSATRDSITNRFTSPTTRSLNLGGDIYTIRIGGFVPPGPPNGIVVGRITATISPREGFVPLAAGATNFAAFNPTPAGATNFALSTPVSFAAPQHAPEPGRWRWPSQAS